MKLFRSLSLLFLLLGLALPGFAQPANPVPSLTVGDKVPDFTLTDQSGKKVSLSQFRGSGVVVSFLFTRCPFPEMCPTLGKNLEALAELANRIGEGKNLQVLSITIDPEHDTPEVLKAYARGFDEKYDNWRFLTGSENDIARVAGAFGVMYWDEDGTIIHNMRTTFIDGDGRIQLSISGSDWRPGEFAAQIKPYLK